MKASEINRRLLLGLFSAKQRVARGLPRSLHDAVRFRGVLLPAGRSEIRGRRVLAGRSGRQRLPVRPQVCLRKDLHCRRTGIFPPRGW